MPVAVAVAVAVPLVAVSRLWWRWWPRWCASGALVRGWWPLAVLHLLGQALKNR